MNLNGLLLVDKPTGCTSHDVVNRVRRALQMTSVGHSGTLDPLASGLMVILLGQATKLSDFILAQDKRYLVTIRLGMTTDSGDRDGKILSQQPVDLDRAQVENTLIGQQGEMRLPVPIFSATRVNGRKLYEYARAEKAVETPCKLMRFYDLGAVTWLEKDLFKVEVSCAKGGYIRSWVTALGENLKVGATVMGLRRLFSGEFKAENAIDLDQLESLSGQEDPRKVLGDFFIPMARTLPRWPQCNVRGREEHLLRNGQISHDLTSRLVVVQKQAHLSQTPIGIKVLGEDGELVGLLEASTTQGLKIRRIFTSQGL